MPDPRPQAYRPFVSARYPAQGRSSQKPAWRVLVHRKHVGEWNRIADMCGESNAAELWWHLSMQPDQPPRLGTVTPMKGGQFGPKDGMSRVHHYEITGGGRIDYRYNAEYTTTAGGDPHKVVQVISIDLGGH